ncbi:PREDICTED: alpha-1-acid glycoprotein [Myotis davidii]|uniref:alpha-1-acid glycoprotein n=1 Tax=Myotis davidii TaxID=225400 RepID=UPI0003EBFDA1|nr:PREDICTED: alpha-1-acid glycoprotein [Myotis davidii]
MALPWALAVLSLLPLLDAQSPACPNFSVPITNASLDQISGKWFYIGSAYRFPEYKKEASKIHAAFFYFTPNHTEDTILLREYMTIGDQCLYNSSSVTVHRENGTLSKSVDKPEATPEQMQQFYDYLTCMGMDKSEVMYTDRPGPSTLFRCRLPSSRSQAGGQACARAPAPPLLIWPPEEAEAQEISSV